MAQQPLDLLWFPPSSGNGTYLGTEKGHRPADIGYLRGNAQAAGRLQQTAVWLRLRFAVVYCFHSRFTLSDLPAFQRSAVGYGGALLAIGTHCLDGWMVGSTLAPQTQRLKFLLAPRPGFMTPGLAARQSVALDRISNGRLLLNILTGGQPKERAGHGLLLDHDERYALTDEFLQIWRRARHCFAPRSANRLRHRHYTVAGVGSFSGTRSGQCWSSGGTIDTDGHGQPFHAEHKRAGGVR